MPMEGEDELMDLLTGEGDGEAGGEDAPATPSSPGAKAEGIDGALPDTGAPSKWSRAARCAQKQCVHKGWLPDEQFAKTVPTGKPGRAALWGQHVTSGSTQVFPRHHGLEVLGVVLDGKALVTGDDGGAPRALGRWWGFRAPGGGVTVHAQGGDANLVLAVVATKTDLGEALSAAKDKPWAVSWRKRPSKIAAFSLEQSEDLAWAGGAAHARLGLGAAEGALPSSFGILMTSSKVPIAEHTHPVWENVAVIEGAATMKIGGKSYAVEPGAILQMPPETPHSVKPGGKSRLLAVQLYTPSGPEQRFKKLAGDAEAKK
jgi:mannose-6-phosphate isomerase-like protein (cupin superfamily)